MRAGDVQEGRVVAQHHQADANPVQDAYHTGHAGKMAERDESSA